MINQRKYLFLPGLIPPTHVATLAAVHATGVGAPAPSTAPLLVHRLRREEQATSASV